MEIGEKVMVMTKEKGRQWDGKSRVSNDLYRKRHDEIFNKLQQEQRDLEESYQQSKRNKKRQYDKS